jgi:hypothetical protein
LRRRKGDCAEGTCEHESGHEQGPNSRSLFCLLIKVAVHLFVLQFSVLFQLQVTAEVGQTHNDLEGAQRIAACGSERPYI